MYIEWTSHIKTEEERERFKLSVLSAKTVLERLSYILEDKEKALDRSEQSIEVYNTPGWDYRQAHKNGNREAFSFLKKLINLDQQKDKQ